MGNDNLDRPSFENVDCSLKDYLKEGNRIKTKFMTDSDWIQNTILSVYGDTVEIKIKIAYITSNIAVNDVMEFKYYLGDYEYLLHGTVDEIKFYMNSITFRIYNAQRILNRRQHPRFDVSLCCYVIPDGEYKPLYGIVQNLSRGGASLQTKADIEIGKTIGLNIYISKDIIISMAIKILRKKTAGGSFIYDASLEAINKTSEKQCEDLFSILEQCDDDLFFEYINSLNKT